MRICINGPTTFVITEQSDKHFETYCFTSPTLGEIEVASSCYPEVRYLEYKTMLFVRGIYGHENYKTLQVNKPEHLTPILKALEKFCTFNEESFEIEPCTL